MCVCLYVCMCPPYVPSTPEKRRGIPWDWCYRRLWATTQVWGTEPGCLQCSQCSLLLSPLPTSKKNELVFLKSHITIVSNILNVWSQQKSEVIISVSFTSESHSCYSEFGLVLPNYGLFPWYPIVQFCFFAFKDFSWEASADLAGLLGASMLNEGKCCAWR